MPQLAWLHHSPNGGKRSAFTGAQMKALGCKAGFPDLVLPDPRRGLAIEMKSEDGRTSEAQDGWLDHFKACGWNVAVCRSAEEARSTICNHFGVPLDVVPPLGT